MLLLLAWESGGYFPSSHLMVGCVSFAVVALVFLVAPPHRDWSRPALVALSALVAYALWAGISLAWSDSPVTGLEEMQRDLMYVGVFCLGLVAAGSGRYARPLVWAVLGVISVIVGAAVLSRVLPHVVHSPPTDAISNYRLEYPLGYWNALGALAAVGTVLALGLSGDPSSPRVVRALSGGAAVMLFVGMYLSLSRGAWLSLAVGLVVLVTLGAHRLSLLLSALVVGAGVALAIGALNGYPALIDEAARGGQVAAGEAYAPILVAVIAVVSVVQFVLASAAASANLMRAGRRVFRPIVLAVAGALLLGALGVYAIASTDVEGRTDNAIRSAGDFVSKEWRDFMRPSTFAASGSARLTSARGTRSELYRVALRGFGAHPLRGDGAGSFEYRFTRERRIDEKVRNAHSLYLETLSDLGLVGLVLLLVFIGALAAAAVRSRLRAGGLGRSQVAAVGAACSVWVAHAGVDWDWQMPGVTAPVLVLACSLLPYGRRTSGTAVKRRPAPLPLTRRR